MFVSSRKCYRPPKPDPISDHNCQNVHPFSDQSGSKTIPFGAAHTYIPYMGEYPPGERSESDEPSLEEIGQAFNEVSSVSSLNGNEILIRKKTEGEFQTYQKKNQRAFSPREVGQ